MSRLFAPLAVLASAVFALSAGASAQAALRVMTFNIRYGTANDGAHAWSFRRAHVVAAVRDHSPHLLGLQEALRSQLDDLSAALPAYRVLGSGRDDGRSGGEYAALLVDTVRFDVLEDGQFWYSDRPDEPGSMTWGNTYPRICVWARLFDRASADTMLVFNQHWDHEVQASRERAATLLLARMIALQAGPLPALVMGDFNAGEQNPAFQRLLANSRIFLRDSFRAVAPGAAFVGTFHGFTGDSTGEKVDAVLVSRHWDIIDAQIDRRRFGRVWPSDHFPVMATVRVRR